VEYEKSGSLVNRSREGYLPFKRDWLHKIVQRNFDKKNKTTKTVGYSPVANIMKLFSCTFKMVRDFFCAWRAHSLT